MANFNKVILAGNITRDIEMRWINNNQNAVCDFGLAINRKWTDKNGNQNEDTTFVDCTAFGRVAEIINQYCNKGSPLMVEGRLKYETWEDKNDGSKRSKLKVAVENVQLLGSPQGNSGNGNRNNNGGNQSRQQHQRPQNRNQQQQRQQQNDDGGWDNNDGWSNNDDIPF